MKVTVTVAPIAASGATAAIFSPVPIGGAVGLRAGGPPADRLARWVEGMETACLTAMRYLDDIEAWSARAETEMTTL